MLKERGSHNIVPCEVLYTEFNQNETVSFARLPSTVLSVFDCFFKLEAMTNYYLCACVAAATTLRAQITQFQSSSYGNSPSR